MILTCMSWELVKVYRSTAVPSGVEPNACLVMVGWWCPDDEADAVVASSAMANARMATGPSRAALPASTRRKRSLCMDPPRAAAVLAHAATAVHGEFADPRTKARIRA